MNQPAEVDDGRPLRPATHSGLATALKAAFWVTAVPVLLWCVFILYAIAKARYDITPLRPLIPFFLTAAVIPGLWFVGAVGSLILARLRKRWVPWALATLSLLVIGLLIIASMFAFTG